jgi:hypothetical protein
VVRITLIKGLKKPREDPTFALLYAGVWTLIKLNVASIVASLPPCRALFLRIVSRIRGKNFQDSHYSSSVEPTKNSGGISGIELKRSVLVTSERNPAGAEGYLRMQDEYRGV